MSKVITKCGVCGIKVAAELNDSDPICADCLEWHNDMLKARQQREDIQSALSALSKSLNKVASVCDYLTRFENSKVLTQNEREVIGSLCNMVFVSQKGLDYIERLK